MRSHRGPKNKQNTKRQVCWVLDTNPVDVHLVHKFLVDFQESVSISEPAELSRTPCLHGSELQSPAALVHLQVEAEVLPLQALHVAQFGHGTDVRFCTRRRNQYCGNIRGRLCKGQQISPGSSEMTRAGLSIPSFGLKVKLTNESHKTNKDHQKNSGTCMRNSEVRRSHDRKTLRHRPKGKHLIGLEYFYISRFRCI